MKINTKNLKKLDASIISGAVTLIEKAEKIDNKQAYGTGFVQSAALAELFVELYNNPDNAVPSEDTAEVVYKKKDQS